MQSVDLAELPQKLRQKPLVSGQVRSVAAGVLGYHDQLLHAAARQHPGFVKHVVQLTAAIFAPKGGNDAVSAMVVTALGDFDKGIVSRRGHDASRFHFRCVDGAKVHHLLPFQQLFNGGNDFRVASRAQNAVHLGHFLQNVPLIPLGQAAGDQDFAHQSLCFQGGGL